MAPTPVPVPAPYAYTYVYTGVAGTFTYTYSYPDYSYSYTFGSSDAYPTTYRGGDLPFDSNTERTVVAVWAIAIGVIFGLQILGLLVVGIVYFQRQKKRKDWYGRMAEHYRNGGLPPWAAAGPGVGDGSVKAPLLPNDYNAHSGATYPPSHHENSSQFGVYNLPPSATLSTNPYSNSTGQTAATYHTANTIPHTSPPHSLSPQSLSPQPRFSQYSTTTSSFEPYNPPPNMHHTNPYAPPAGPPMQYGTPSPPSTQYGAPSRPPTQYGAPSSPTPSTPAPYGDAPAYDAPPRTSQYAQASGSSSVPAYSGGAYGPNEYPKEKGWEYTAPPSEPPAK